MIIPMWVRVAGWIAIVAYAVGGGILLDHYLGWKCTIYPLCLAAGLALLAFVIRGASVAGRYLAVYGRSPDGRPLSRLVREGPYSCMRHPMHFFLALFPEALALIAGSPAGALITGPSAAILTMVLAATLDELESIDRFGDEYLEYKRSVPAFNPSPSCLAKSLLHMPPRHRPSRSRRARGGGVAAGLHAEATR